LSEIAAYAVRISALEGPTLYFLTDSELVEQRPRGAERRHRLEETRFVRISGAAAPRGPRSLVLGLGKRRLAIASHGLRRPFGLEDQTPAFAVFARAVCAQVAEASPRARFLTDARGQFTGLDGLLGLIGLSILILAPAALAADMPALGLDLSARLAFVFCLLLALRPWMRNTRGRGFDPRAIPAEVLPV